MNNYSVENYIRDIRKVVNEEVAEKSITERIKPLALRLAEDKSWIKPCLLYTSPSPRDCLLSRMPSYA